jgi:hypothetical protein
LHSPDLQQAKKEALGQVLAFLRSQAQQGSEAGQHERGQGTAQLHLGLGAARRHCEGQKQGHLWQRLQLHQGLAGDSTFVVQGWQKVFQKQLLQR